MMQWLVSLVFFHGTAHRGRVAVTTHFLASPFENAVQPIGLCDEMGAHLMSDRARAFIGQTRVNVASAWCPILHVSAAKTADEAGRRRLCRRTIHTGNGGALGETECRLFEPSSPKAPRLAVERRLAGRPRMVSALCLRVCRWWHATETEAVQISIPTRSPVLAPQVDLVWDVFYEPVHRWEQGLAKLERQVECAAPVSVRNQNTCSWACIATSRVISPSLGAYGVE